MSEEQKNENLGNNSQNKSVERKRTPVDIVKEAMPSYPNLTYSECDKRMQAINAQLQAKLEQIRNPEALKAVISLNEKLKNSCNLLSAVDSETRQKLFQNYSKIQQQVNKVLAAPHVMQETIAAYKRMGDALCNAALSGSVADFQKYIGLALDAEKEFSKSASDSQDENTSDIAKETITEISEKVTDANLSECKTTVWVLLESILDQNIGQRLTAIETLLRNFLRKFEIIAEKNSKSSNRWAWASCFLSIVAIAIAVWSEWSDKTGELIEVVKKSHPWSEQQISADDAKNVSVAFHAITEALQKNVQLEKETDRLQDDLSKAQGDLAALQKQYDASAANFSHEKQKLYAEISALKKQIEELKAELAKRPVPSPASTQEDKK